MVELESEPSGFQTITGLVSATQKAAKDSQVQAFPSMWVTKLGTIQKKRLPQKQCKEFFFLNKNQTVLAAIECCETHF